MSAMCAARIAQLNIPDVVLMRAADGLAEDLNAAAALTGYEPRVTSAGGWEDTDGSDVVVLGGGTVDEVVDPIRDRSPDAVVLVAIDPVEVSCHAMLRLTQFPRSRVIGISGLAQLGLARAQSAIERGGSVLDERDVGNRDIPSPGPWSESAAVAAVAEAICRNSRRVIRCAALCQGEYGIDALYTVVPVRVGRDGVEEIVEVPISDEYRGDLQRAAAAVRKALHL